MLLLWKCLVLPARFIRSWMEVSHSRITSCVIWMTYIKFYKNLLNHERRARIRKLRSKVTLWKNKLNPKWLYIILRLFPTIVSFMIEVGRLCNKMSSLYETLVACVTPLIRSLLHSILPYGSRVRLKQAAIPLAYRGSCPEQRVIKVNSSNLLVSSGASLLNSQRSLFRVTRLISQYVH